MGRKLRSMSVMFTLELRSLMTAVAEYDATRAEDNGKRESQIGRARKRAVISHAQHNAQVRADIIAALKNGTMTTPALANKIGRERSTLLRHLNMLQDEGIVICGGFRFKKNWTLCNVELTGAARLYRAASSDCKERR
jgi:hypothetical protein